MLVAFAGMAAIRAGATGEAFMGALNRPFPALASTEPHLATEVAPRLARRVVVVIIDGLRLRDSYGLPFLDGLRRRGIDASASSHYPSWSRPNYVSILTGVPPVISGVRNNHFRYPVLLDSLMDRANDAGMQVGYVGTWDGPPELFLQPINAASFGVDIEFASDFLDAHFAPWSGGFLSGARLLIRRHYPLVVMLAGDVDKAGHDEGAASDAYRIAARRVDQQLAKALEDIDLVRDAIVVVADHGHTDRGGHGGTEPEVLQVPFILAGAGIRAGSAIVDAQLIDVAPTVAALLGLPAPGHGLGRTLTDGLIISESTAARIAGADQERIRRNQMVVATERSGAARSQTQLRIYRSVLLLGILAIALLIGVALGRAGGMHIRWPALAIFVPVFPAVYYAMLAIFGDTFSPSVVPERGSVVDKLFLFGLVSTGVQIVAGWVALSQRVVLTDRLATANFLAFVGLLTALLPAGVTWAYYPPTFVEVPGPALLVLIPSVYIAVACYAIAIAATLALETIIFFARANDPRIRIARLEASMAKERARLRADE